MAEVHHNEISGNPENAIQIGTIGGDANFNIGTRYELDLRPNRPVVPLLVLGPLAGGAGAFLLQSRGWPGAVGVLMVATGLLLTGAGVWWFWRNRWEKWSITEERLARQVANLAPAVLAGYRRELEQAGADPDSAIAVRWGVPDGVRQASGAGDFRRSGEIGEAAKLLRSVPSRRLVILGPAGAGKSVLATALAAQLLEDRGKKDPIPVVVSLAGWVPSRERLLKWAARRLAAAHPDLGRSVADARLVAARLLENGRILPVLDGLDEIPAEARAAALAELNRTGAARLPLVLTSRPDEYTGAVEAAGTLLASAAVVELRPLVAGQILASLPLADSSPGADERWRPVLDALAAGEAEPLREALASPLMVGLARAAYARTADDPAELLDLPDAESVENRLLERFVPAAYADADGERGEDARRWLGYLAWHLRENDENDLEWWRLDEALPATVRALAPASALVVTTAVIWALDYRVPHRYWMARVLAPDAASVAVWAMFPVLAYLCLLTWSQIAREGWLMPPKRLRSLGEVRRTANAREGAGAGGHAAMPLVAAVLAALGIWLDGPLGRYAAASLLLAAVIVFWRFAARFGVTADPAEESGPPGLLRADRRAALGLGWSHALGEVWPLPLLLGAPFLLALRWEHRLDPAALGLALVLDLAVFWYAGIVLSSWGRFRVAHAWLALRGRVPHDLMGFLEDARERGVLRQSGGGYRFRHGALRDRLAERYAEEARRPPRPQTEPQLLWDGRALLGMELLCLVMLYLIVLPGADGGRVLGFVRWGVGAHDVYRAESVCELVRPRLAGDFSVPVRVPDRSKVRCEFVEGDPLRPGLRLTIGVTSAASFSTDPSQSGTVDFVPDAKAEIRSAGPFHAKADATWVGNTYSLELFREEADPGLGVRARYDLDQALARGFTGGANHYAPTASPPGRPPAPSDARFVLYDRNRPARVVVGPTWTADDWSRLWALDGLGFAFRGPEFGQCVRDGGRWYCVRPHDAPSGRRSGPLQLEIEQRPCAGACPPPRTGTEAQWWRRDAATWYAERWDGHAYTLDVHAVRGGDTLDLRVTTVDTLADVARKTVNDISAQSSR
ncbi:NACHT domain-containing protein [Actinomadura gamaensis]|uniref:NACHT domain-containing protein n=1 Tax=Actinomadura gamaensis TaxID=1763541 RepID=A0ABV9TT15_9ACTN